MTAAPPNSCDVSDACDELGVPAVRTGVLRRAWQGCPPLSGLLTAVRLEPAGGTPLPQLLEILSGAGERVVLVDLRGRVDVQCWGTVLATAAQAFGVRGALINGAARDVEGLQQLAFPTYARGVYPARMRGRLGVAAVDEPVELEGSTVEPGGFAVADASGAVFLPADRSHEVLTLAVELRDQEETQLQVILRGADPRQVLRPEPDGTSDEPR